MPKFRLPAAQAISLIHAAGGVAAWAHPPYDSLQQHGRALREMGLDAVEVEYPNRRPATVRSYRSDTWDVERFRVPAFQADRGWAVEGSQATFYLWMRVQGGDDVAFVRRLLRIGLVATPGSFLGAAGSGFVRWALVPTLEECREALTRLDAVSGAERR